MGLQIKILNNVCQSPHIYEIVTATTNLVDIFQTGNFQRNSMEKNCIHIGYKTGDSHKSVIIHLVSM